MRHTKQNINRRQHRQYQPDGASKQINALLQEGLLADGTRADLLKNNLVLIVPQGNREIMTIEDMGKVVFEKYGFESL